MSKQPHKCPVCDGKGSVVESGGYTTTCHACKGEGVVWSPPSPEEARPSPQFGDPLDLTDWPA